MAIVQRSLFTWQDVYEQGDLARLQLVLDNIDDEALMQQLERARGKGRNDYPIRALWNALLAGLVYQHASIAQLRRELLRNGDLLRLCGFSTTAGIAAVPPSWVFSRFLGKLKQAHAAIDAIFHQQVELLRRHLPRLGERLGVDGKAIWSAAQHRNDNRSRDGRRDTDAEYGAKHYETIDASGKVHKKEIWWFGYKVHLLADVTYELPLGYTVTKANVTDIEQLPPLMVQHRKHHPRLCKRAQTLVGDRGYDSKENNTLLWDEYGIKPVIDNRHCWREREEKTRSVNLEKADNVVYTEDGEVSCVCPETGTERPMVFMGFEKKRECLKYRCPAAAYNCVCEGRDLCGNGKTTGFGRVVRIPLAKDRRLFTPLARHTYAFTRFYKQRTAVERINSRLDVSFGFEQHYIRGIDKMHCRMGIALIVMLAMARGRLRQKQRDDIRSLVAAVSPPHTRKAA